MQKMNYYISWFEINNNIKSQEQKNATSSDFKHINGVKTEFPTMFLVEENQNTMIFHATSSI